MSRSGAGHAATLGEGERSWPGPQTLVGTVTSQNRGSAPEPQGTVTVRSREQALGPGVSPSHGGASRFLGVHSHTAHRGLRRGAQLQEGVRPELLQDPQATLRQFRAPCSPPQHQRGKTPCGIHPKTGSAAWDKAWLCPCSCESLGTSTFFFEPRSAPLLNGGD